MSTAATFMPVTPSTGALHPLGIDQVRITGGFWGDRQQLNVDAIIPHALKWETKVGWIDNFLHTASGDIAEHRTGREFADSDVYKLIEAMAWEVGRTGNQELEAEIERLGKLIQAIQCEDGYINTNFGNPGQAPRYSDFVWGHELYCFGHLIQAGVARLRTGRSGAIVEVALKAADHVCREFAEGARKEVCGHPEIEVALAELGRVTGEEKYLNQAKDFIDRRGYGVLPDIEFGRSYYQDETPFREATVLRGHAVRALYLCAAAVDVAVERGDQELLEVARKQFDTALARRTYLTGGMGSHHQDEAFGEDFELPPDRSYCETCAGVASIMVAWRLLLATGELSYGDVIERTLYNVVAASPSEQGNAFFYSNSLQRRTPAAQASPDEAVPRANSSLRAPWFEVSCCPTNVSRTLASLATFVATTDDQGVQLLQYLPGTINTQLPSGAVQLSVATNYPYDESIEITVTETAAPFELALRVPLWAVGASVNGVPVEPGTHRIPNTKAGDQIRLLLPVAPRISYPDYRVDAIRGSIAIERGPLVLCIESVDLPEGVEVDQIAVLPDAKPITAGVAGAKIQGVLLQHAERVWPYGSPQAPTASQETELSFVPYHSWANRGPVTMRVWAPLASN